MGFFWIPRRPPLNTEVWFPPESHFGSSTFMCAMFCHENGLNYFSSIYVEIYVEILQKDINRNALAISFSLNTACVIQP